MCGSPEYLVNWWSCEILFYEMIGGIEPFSNDAPMMIYQKY